jgi:hypothetical protein
MKLYLDDNMASGRLAALLSRAGHDVQVPADVAMAGKSDPLHLIHAVQQGHVLLSFDYADFEELYLLIVAVGGHQPGIFVVRQDNDPSRDLKPPGIVRAIANLIASGTPIPGGYHILNHWR